MRIAIVVSSLYEFAGIGRMALSVASAFEKKGHTVIFITGNPGTYTHACVVHFQTRNPLVYMRDIVRARKYIADCEYILCFDLLPAGFFAYALSLATRIPLFLHCIGTYSLFPKKGFLKKEIMKQILRSAVQVFVLSSPVLRHIEASAGLFRIPHPILLSPGVNVDFFHAVNEQLSLSVPSYFITVGEVKKRKGHDISIAAFGEVASKYPDVHYVIVGQYDRLSPFAKTISDIIAQHRLGDRIHFIENASDTELRALYSKARFFIMTSRTTEDFIEGFGIVYLEAALCGIPAIGACDTGAEDALEDHETGLVVPLSIDAVKNAMVWMLDHSSEVQVMGKKAHDRAECYTWDHISETYLTAFLQHTHSHI